MGRASIKAEKVGKEVAHILVTFGRNLWVGENQTIMVYCLHRSGFSYIDFFYRAERAY